MIPPIFYHCSGLDERGAPCKKLLFIWRPPKIEFSKGLHFDFGQIEIKCRRCKTINHVKTAESLPVPTSPCKT